MYVFMGRLSINDGNSHGIPMRSQEPNEPQTPFSCSDPSTFDDEFDDESCLNEWTMCNKNEHFTHTTYVCCETSISYTQYHVFQPNDLKDLQFTCQWFYAWWVVFQGMHLRFANDLTIPTRAVFSAILSSLAGRLLWDNDWRGGGANSKLSFRDRPQVS